MTKPNQQSSHRETQRGPPFPSGLLYKHVSERGLPGPPERMQARGKQQSWQSLQALPHLPSQVFAQQAGCPSRVGDKACEQLPQ